MAKKLIIHTDGGSRGNPGIAGAGVVISEADGPEVFAAGFFLGKTTNNVAEYTGLVKGLEAAVELNADEVNVFLDSELLVKQMNGQYKVKSPILKPLYDQAQQLLSNFKRSKIAHVYREHNSDADSFANQAMDAQADVGGNVDQNDTPCPDSPTANGILLKHVELRDKATFDKAKPVRVMLSKEEELFAGLICLEPGQKHSATLECQQATVTVMRGKGHLQSCGKKHKLQAGSWLHLSAVTQLDFTADTKEQLVIILTVLE